MPIDFFIAPCARDMGSCKKNGVVCKRTTDISRFGISDKDSTKREPAILDTENERIWDLTVNNPVNKEITFKAVDYCVEVFRTGNELIKRCEGFLQYENKLLFIEIKNRPNRRWLIDAREKFEETILKFRESHPDESFELLAPVVSNKLHPRPHQNEMIQRQKLKDCIGMEFRVATEITID